MVISKELQDYEKLQFYIDKIKALEEENKKILNSSVEMLMTPCEKHHQEMIELPLDEIFNPCGLCFNELKEENQRLKAQIESLRDVPQNKRKE
jgi:hypothetical protein